MMLVVPLYLTLIVNVPSFLHLDLDLRAYISFYFIYMLICYFMTASLFLFYKYMSVDPYNIMSGRHEIFDIVATLFDFIFIYSIAHIVFIFLIRSTLINLISSLQIYDEFFLILLIMSLIITIRLREASQCMYSILLLIWASGCFISIICNLPFAFLISNTTLIFCLFLQYSQEKLYKRTFSVSENLSIIWKHLVHTNIVPIISVPVIWLVIQPSLSKAIDIFISVIICYYMRLISR